MKKWSFIVLCFLSFSIAHADHPEKVANLASKVVLQNTNGYFVLSDGSCWKAIGFSKRWRSLSEWWNNVQLIPENYECTPSEWFLGAQIEAYPKYGNLNVNLADAANQEDLKLCTHLLVNSKTGKVLFAVSLDAGDCIVQLFNDAHDEGYQKGLEKGKADSYQNANDSYNRGRAAGYQAGYADGYGRILRAIPPGA
jgi:hypothetical protein